MILANHTTPLVLGSALRCLMLDLGDVVCTYTFPPNSPLDGELLKRILNSGIYYAYQCGKISKEDAYANLSTKFLAPVEHISSSLAMVSDTLQVDADVIAYLTELRHHPSHKGLSIYAIFTGPYFETLKFKFSKEDLNFFDDVLISAVSHERKPNPGFYKYVIENKKLDVQHTLFIDDKRENVGTARTCGMYAMLGSGPESLQRLKRMFNDPVESAINFLRTNAGDLNSVTDEGVALYENFTQMYILELLEYSSLVNIQYGKGTKTNFFQGEGTLTT